jgi:hypothetical protein
MATLALFLKESVAPLENGRGREIAGRSFNAKARRKAGFGFSRMGLSRLRPKAQCLEAWRRRADIDWRDGLDDFKYRHDDCSLAAALL